MNKARWLLWGNAFLGISFVFQVITSVVLFFVAMSKAQEHMVYLVHAYNGFLLVAFSILHIGLHWRTVKIVYFE
ncbi:MAG: DUF4405 domain-containing protein [Candidatus Omnitrophica bacterium]|nr:DUF4405 domain-containing protein [Candidatus Omnitrophota bacterium]